MKPSGPRLFFCGKILYTNSIPLLAIGMFKFSIISWVRILYTFLGTYSFHLSSLICLCSAQCSLVILFLSVRSAGMSTLPFQILEILTFFCSWRLVSFVDLCKEPTFSFTDFFPLFFYSIYFLSVHHFLSSVFWVCFAPFPLVFNEWYWSNWTSIEGRRLQPKSHTLCNNYSRKKIVRA